MPIIIQAAANTDIAQVIRDDFIAGANRRGGDCCILKALRRYAATDERCGIVLRRFYTDIYLIGKAPPPLTIAGISKVVPIGYRLSNVARRIRRPVRYVLVRHLRVAIQRTPRGHVDPSVRADESVLSVLRRVVW